MARPHPRGKPSHVTPFGEDQHCIGFDVVGESHGTPYQLLSRRGELGFFLIVSPATALNTSGDRVHDLDATQGVFSDSGLATEHDGVALLKDRIGHVRNLGPGGRRTLDHAL